MSNIFDKTVFNSSIAYEFVFSFLFTSLYFRVSLFFFVPYLEFIHSSRSSAYSNILCKYTHFNFPSFSWTRRWENWSRLSQIETEKSDHDYKKSKQENNPFITYKLSILAGLFDLFLCPFSNEMRGNNKKKTIENNNKSYWVFSFGLVWIAKLIYPTIATIASSLFFSARLQFTSRSIQLCCLFASFSVSRR